MADSSTQPTVTIASPTKFPDTVVQTQMEELLLLQKRAVFLLTIIAEAVAGPTHFDADLYDNLNN